MLKAQALTDSIYMPSIKTIKFFQQNNQESLPVIRLHSSDLVELHFDDLDGVVKNYYYTFQLCNANWEAADISSFDYIQGYQQMMISQYRISSISQVKYIHYMALLPENNYIPIKSGNYLLKVYLNADLTQLAFTKRFFVVDSKVNLSTQFSQQIDNALMYTHQKIQFTLNTRALSLYNPQQQIKVAILQNNRWDNALTDFQPTFIRNNILEYSGEDGYLFQGMREFRWADLRTFIFQTERVDSVNKKLLPIDIYLKPDISRSRSGYLTMNDLNGSYEVSTTEAENPWWQGDYANVHFTYLPNNQTPFEDKDLYMVGELTGNALTKEAKMKYNEEKGVYEKILLLKQGYYNYAYVTKNKNDASAKADASLTEGNFWETENNYTILVYYRSVDGRYDELVAVTTFNTRNGTSL